MSNKFDICLMNPPYGAHGHGIHEKFLSRSFDLARKVCSIQPLSWLLGKKQTKSITQVIDKHGATIESTKARNDFDAEIIGEVAIIFVEQDKRNPIIFDDKKYDDCSEIHPYSNDNSLNELAKKISYDGKVVDSLQDHWIIDNEGMKKDHWYIQIPKLRGNTTKTGIKSTDFYTIISNDESFISDNKIGMTNDIPADASICYFQFKNKKELLNFINYIKTDFVRGCLLLTKFNMNLLSGSMLRSIPWQDFSDEIYSHRPHEIDDYLFKKYDISDDTREHIEDILPDYYHIR